MYVLLCFYSLLKTDLPQPASVSITVFFYNRYFGD